MAIAGTHYKRVLTSGKPLSARSRRSRSRLARTWSGPFRIVPTWGASSPPDLPLAAIGATLAESGDSTRFDDGAATPREPEDRPFEGRPGRPRGAQFAQRLASRLRKLFFQTGRIQVFDAYIQWHIFTDDPTPLDAGKYFWKLARRTGGYL